jgi:hypothetical protein
MGLCRPPASKYHPSRLTNDVVRSIAPPEARLCEQFLRAILVDRFVNFWILGGAVHPAKRERWALGVK